MTPAEFIRAARVPRSIEPQRFGLWTIERKGAGETILGDLGTGPYGEVGFPYYTLLWRVTDRSVHLGPLGEIVMEDSRRELRKHLPIWMTARGRVLKTGLGLGCVVRGLLANPEVEHVDVVEIDADIIRIIGAEFIGNPRVTIHHADALDWDAGDRRWNYAWHDLHSFDDRALQVMHGALISRFLDQVDGNNQGAWAWPREIAHRLPIRLLGTARTASNKR